MHNAIVKFKKHHLFKVKNTKRKSDEDSVHVRDICKAFVDGGYDVFRKEISKYKVELTDSRQKSAPSKRNSFINHQKTNPFLRNKSANYNKESIEIPVNKSMGCFLPNDKKLQCFVSKLDDKKEVHKAKM